MSRAIHSANRQARPFYISFNPRPVYEPGDTQQDPEAGAPGRVSIRARFMSRAIPILASPVAAVGKRGFNPRPVYEPGDTFAWRVLRQ